VGQQPTVHEQLRGALGRHCMQGSCPVVFISNVAVVVFPNTPIVPSASTKSATAEPLLQRTGHAAEDDSILSRDLWR
jgi:hypothetical protein